MILIRGHNFYPVDIEGTATNADEHFRAGFCAAFTVEVDNQEQLVIAQEIEPRVREFDHATAIENIRQKVAATHEVSVYAVVLLKAGDIPQTSSGKTQRFACRAKFLENDWKPIAQWVYTPVTPDVNKDDESPKIAKQSVSDSGELPTEQPASNAALDAEELQEWLIDRIAGRLMLPTHRIQADAPFIELGLSSLDAVEITNDLSAHVGMTLSPTAIYQYPTIAVLAKKLANREIEQLESKADFNRNDVRVASTANTVNGQTADAIKETRESTNTANEAIAIVGVGCRFPGGIVDLSSFWSLLENGVDAIGPVPEGRWNNDDYYDEDTLAPGKLGVRVGGYIEKIDEFDAEFFGVSPREALRMDPQQRLLLETTWEALETAGIQPSKLYGTRTGVYVGAIYNDYFLRQLGTFEDMDVFNGTGNSLAIAGNRLSYFLGVNGPSLTVDTACSSSLVTAHLACTSLRSGETDMGIVAGVNLILGPEVTMVLTKAQMLSPDGHCKAFDASADGYARAEGCAVIVLKRLSDAQRDGDRIFGAITGSAVTHVGRSNGISAPNGPSQEMAMHDALNAAGLSPSDVDYVEAHGTGTRLGDPIEMEAIKNVYCQGVDRDQTLMVGSVKTNFGHTESTAGLAGLIKALLILQHQQVPPHLHLKEPNPILHLEDGLVEIPTSNKKLAQIDNVAVSSFGFGGTNTHVVLSRVASPKLSTTVGSEAELFTFSARTTTALQARIASVADYLDSASDQLRLRDIAHTLNHGREAFEFRLAFRAESLDDLRSQLNDLRQNGTSATSVTGDCSDFEKPKIAFLYSGQGSQYGGMGKSLYLTEPVFKDAIDRCSAIINDLKSQSQDLQNCDFSVFSSDLHDVLFGDASDHIDETGYTQPALFAYQYALTQLWASWGITPSAVLGHSVGEFAAAVTAGILSLEDGMRLIATGRA